MYFFFFLGLILTVEFINVPDIHIQRGAIIGIQWPLYLQLK